MMTAKVCKILDFPAAHRNTRYNGHCNRIHGHTWTIEIHAKGIVDEDLESPHYGMVIDFAQLKQVYQSIVEPHVEHQNLNETLGHILEEFTTEIIAGWILDELHAQMPQIYKVRLWEGKSSYAEVCIQDIEGRKNKGRKISGTSNPKTS